MRGVTSQGPASGRRQIAEQPRAQKEREKGVKEEELARRKKVGRILEKNFPELDETQRGTLGKCTQILMKQRWPASDIPKVLPFLAEHISKGASAKIAVATLFSELQKAREEASAGLRRGAAGAEKEIKEKSAEKRVEKKVESKPGAKPEARPEAKPEAKPEDINITKEQPKGFWGKLKAFGKSVGVRAGIISRSRQEILEERIISARGEREKAESALKSAADEGGQRRRLESELDALRASELSLIETARTEIFKYKLSDKKREIVGRNLINNYVNKFANIVVLGKEGNEEFARFSKVLMDYEILKPENLESLLVARKNEKGEKERIEELRALMADRKFIMVSRMMSAFLKRKPSGVLKAATSRILSVLEEGYDRLSSYAGSEQRFNRRADLAAPENALLGRFIINLSKSSDGYDRKVAEFSLDLLAKMEGGSFNSVYARQKYMRARGAAMYAMEGVLARQNISSILFMRHANAEVEHVVSKGGKVSRDVLGLFAENAGSNVNALVRDGVFREEGGAYVVHDINKAIYAVRLAHKNSAEKIFARADSEIESINMIRAQEGISLSQRFITLRASLNLWERIQADVVVSGLRDYGKFDGEYTNLLLSGPVYDSVRGRYGRLTLLSPNNWWLGTALNKSFANTQLIEEHKNLTEEKVQLLKTVEQEQAKVNQSGAKVAVLKGRVDTLKEGVQEAEDILARVQKMKGEEREKIIGEFRARKEELKKERRTKLDTNLAEMKGFAREGIKVINAAGVKASPVTRLLRWLGVEPRVSAESAKSKKDTQDK